MGWSGSGRDLGVKDGCESPYKNRRMCVCVCAEVYKIVCLLLFLCTEGIDPDAVVLIDAISVFGSFSRSSLKQTGSFEYR